METAETNFYLVSYLPEEVSNEAMRLAARLSERFHTHTFMDQWEPHLTVGSGLFVPDNRLKVAVESLRKIAGTMDPLTVMAEWIGSTDNLNPKIARNPYVIWINVILSPELQAVFDTLEKYPEFRKDGYAITKYSPHITLAFDDLTEENYEPAIAFLKGEHPKFQFLLDSFSMVSFDENLKKWVEFERFPLSKNSIYQWRQT